MTARLGSARLIAVVLGGLIVASLSGCLFGPPATTCNSCAPQGNEVCDPIAGVCATPRPFDPLPTATPSPTSVAADGTPPPYSLISARSVAVVGSADEVLVDIPFTTEISAAAAQLATAIDEEPTVTPLPDVKCAEPATVYDWGGLTFTTIRPVDLPEDLAFVATATSPTTAAGLDILSFGRMQVGNPMDDVFANVDGAIADRPGALIDVQPDSAHGRWGVVLLQWDGDLNTGLVRSITAPNYDEYGQKICREGM